MTHDGARRFHRSRSMEEHKCAACQGSIPPQEEHIREDCAIANREGRTPRHYCMGADCLPPGLEVRPYNRVPPSQLMRDLELARQAGRREAAEQIRAILPPPPGTYQRQLTPWYAPGGGHGKAPGGPPVGLGGGFPESPGPEAPRGRLTGRPSEPL